MLYRFKYAGYFTFIIKASLCSSHYKVRYLRDGQYFNYIFGGKAPSKDKDVSTPARRRADTWPKSSNESKTDSRMVRLKRNSNKNSVKPLVQMLDLIQCIVKISNIYLFWNMSYQSKLLSIPPSWICISMIYIFGYVYYAYQNKIYRILWYNSHLDKFAAAHFNERPDVFTQYKAPP